MAFTDRASFEDRPFAPPLDIEIDLPVPPSVNRARRIDWSQHRQHKQWVRSADVLILAARGRSHQPVPRAMAGAFEATVILSEKHTRIDLDNSLKCLLDYAKRIELIVDDGPKYLRRLVVEWGYAPEGCRLILRAL